MPPKGRNKGGGRLPPSFSDKDSEGRVIREYTVDQVNHRNRTEIQKSSPTVKISLMSADLSRVHNTVYIDRTREMPDVVLYQGKTYYAYDTAVALPQYAEALVAHGHAINAIEKD